MNKFQISEDARVDMCKGCGAGIFWQKTKNGKWMPLDPDGTPHWSTCPKAEEFRRNKQEDNNGRA